MSEVIKMDDNNIKFKAIQIFSNPPMMQVFVNIGLAKPDNYKVIIKLKRIRDILKNEAHLIDEAMDDIRKRILQTSNITEIQIGSQEAIMLDQELRNFLEQYEIEIPFEKIKLSEITLSNQFPPLIQLEVLEGFIEIDEDK